jgi:tRNA threonylcarbamoyladenosine biosynthesis protein TsaE
MTFTSRSLQDTAVAAQNILGNLAEKLHTDQATIVGLSGHLGAGKTAFVKAAAKHLGLGEEITSPTFVIMKQYPLSGAAWKQLIHIDAYRLEAGKELHVLDFGKLAADKDNLILLEWPENVREVLGQFELTTITFELSGNGEERTITVTP